MIRKLLKNLLGNWFTESNERYAKINFTIIFLMFIISAIMLLFLPEQLPIIHEGAKTYNVPSILGVWLFPVLALVINLSFIKQKRLSPINSIAFGIIAIIMTVFISTHFNIWRLVHEWPVKKILYFKKEGSLLIILLYCI